MAPFATGEGQCVRRDYGAIDISLLRATFIGPFAGARARGRIAVVTGLRANNRGRWEL